MHWSEALNGDISVGSDGGINALLRGSEDFNGHSIARTETIVGRCGNIHVGLETECLVVEDVVSEDAVLFYFLLFQQLLQQGDGVNRHDTAQLGLHLKEVRVVLVLEVRAVAPEHLAAAACSSRDALLAVVGAHTVVGIVDGFISHAAHTRLLYLPLILSFDALYLLNVYAALNQLRHYLGLSATLFLLFQNKGNNLFIGH